MFVSRDRSLLLTIGVFAGLGVAHAARQDEHAPVDFDRDVRPILADRCFKCHGPDAGARRAGLRLDSFDDAVAEREGRSAIVPGNPGTSALLERITSDDPGLRMPPPESKLDVTGDEAELLARWIAEGAEYAEHWAFARPERHSPPAVEDDAWARDPLDRFVLARLERAGLEPSPEADRATWLRRASFTLTGLPPSLEELDTFLGDEAEGAYERAVQRLFASPRYGERMASDWLDVARYADTYGYQADVYREVWPWRDWVIRAFQDNLAFDEFITWQVAGDLLPEPTRDQRLATAFNRLHRQTNEGGSTEEEYRVEYVSDRLHTFGTAFLGLTLECARCHDHKFDPVSQEEYYELSAFFAQIDESGLYSHFTNAVPTPTLQLPTDEQASELRGLEVAVEAAERALADARRDEWPLPHISNDDSARALQGSYSMDGSEGTELVNAAKTDAPGKIHGANRRTEGHAGGAVELTGDDPLTFPGVGHFRRFDPFTIALWLRVPTEMERAVVLHRSKSWTDSGSRGYQLLIEQGRLSAALVHFWPGNAISVRAREPLPIGEWVHVAVTYDGSSRADGLHLFVDGVPAASDVVRDGLTRMIIRGAEGDLTIGERFRDNGFARGAVDELVVFSRELAPAEVSGGLFLGTAYTLDEPDELTDALAALREARRARDDARDRVREVMTMAALGETRPTYVLTRGQYDARTKEVEAGTPRALPALPEGASRDRLGLARWLTEGAHPLTARVAVNRLWQMGFGVGLVQTPENFGLQGAPATHPQLLDTLSVEFMESGWDVQALLARLVLSATYRQSSRVSDDVRERDPTNRLYSRAPSYRLPAEMVRDTALAASGLLVERVGGPSVKPYQPDGLWQEKSGQRYTPDEGDGLYRRSLYTFWKRTSPPPAMMIFDAAKRDVCVVRRQTTNTPLQALVMLNDPQFVEAARVFGERMLRASEDPVEQLVLGFRTLSAQHPSDAELDVLVRLRAKLRPELAAAPDEVRDLLAVGKHVADPSLDPVELATMALVASTLFSHDATVIQR